MEISGIYYFFKIILIVLIAIILVFAGIKKQPGFGIIFALIIIALQLINNDGSLADVGFIAPESWLLTILLGLSIGVLIQFLSVTLIEPLTEKITGEKHDHSIINAVKGNWKTYLQWLVIVWLLAAILEEAIFRGYFILGLTSLIGEDVLGITLSILFSSMVFGLSHGYQNKCGILSTGVVGVILGLIFVLSEYNLWIVIFTHGFIDTIGISLIAIGYDQKLKIKI